MASYLSVDLDYFSDPVAMGRYLFRLVSMFWTDLYIREHHHQLIQHINRFEPDSIVNVDYHSDMPQLGCNGSAVPLDEATWPLHVRGAREEFLWVYPRMACVRSPHNGNVVTGSGVLYGNGWCHDEEGPNPFTVRDPRPVCGWGRVRRRHGRLPDPEGFDAAGVCVSPFYTDEHVIAEFRQVLRDIGWKVRIR